MVTRLRTWSLRLLVAGVSILLLLSALGWWRAPARADASLTDQVTVVMVVPAGGTQDSTTPQQVVDAVNGPVADYWNRQSSGAIRLGVTGQVDWYQSTYGCSDRLDLFNEAAQRAGWSRDNGRDLLLYLPSGSAGCGRELAEPGTYLHAPGEMWVTDLTTDILARAFGSTMGFTRSDAEQCDGTVEDLPCQFVSLGDYYDVMGGLQDQLGSLSVVQAAGQGLLPPQQLAAVSMSDAPTTVTLSPVSGTTGVRALSLTVPGSAVYWLEYRPANGQDAWLGTAANTRGLEPGVLLRRTQLGSPPELLDGTPSTAANWGTDTHQALPVGSTLQLADGIFSVTVTSEGADAVVHVVPSSPITSAYKNAYGGAAGTLGAPTGPEQCAGPNYATYCYRTYQHGNIYWYLPGGAHAVQGAILQTWLAAGGPAGRYGLPLKDAVCDASGGCSQQFAVGTIYSTPTPGPGWSPGTNRLPIGNFETLSSTGTSLDVAGWALDQDQPASPIAVHVYIDGRWATALTANGPRPDVGRAFPQAGSAHGFSWSTTVAPGQHSVCAYAIDLQLPQTHTLLGCRTVAVAMRLPVGNLEGATANGTTLSVSGWALDPDSPTVASTVHVYVDGRWATALTANGSRPDVGRAFPGAGSAHGFSWSTTVAPGQHSVCLYAIDAQVPQTHTLLGCRTVAVAMRLPVGNWESATANGTTLSVSGWALDPDSPAVSSVVHVYVDGRWGTALTASGSRPDVGRAFPGAGAAHGFSWSTTVAPGQHTVCLYAIDAQQAWTHTDLGCRTLSASA